MFRISLGITLAISEASQFNSIRAVLIVPANISLGMDFDKEGISCLLIGAAKHGQYCVGGEEQQYQMIESVKDDLRKIIEFASKQTSQVLSSRPKASIPLQDSYRFFVIRLSSTNCVFSCVPRPPVNDLVAYTRICNQISFRGSSKQSAGRHPHILRSLKMAC